MRSNILFIKTAKCATESIRLHLIEYAESELLGINDGNFDNFFNNTSFNVNTNHIWYNEKSLNHFYNSIDKNLPLVFVPLPGKPKLWLPITVNLAPDAVLVVATPTLPFDKTDK